MKSRNLLGNLGSLCYHVSARHPSWFNRIRVPLQLIQNIKDTVPKKAFYDAYRVKSQNLTWKPIPSLPTGRFGYLVEQMKHLERPVCRKTYRRFLDMYEINHPDILSWVQDHIDDLIHADDLFYMSQHRLLQNYPLTCQRFVGLDVQVYAESSMRYSTVYDRNRIGDIKYTICCFNSSTTLSKQDEAVLVEVRRHLRCMLHLSSVQGNITLNIVLTPFLKKVSFEKDASIGPKNVNSGSTSYFHHNYNSTITLWRREEIVKVLVHELIHALKIDFKTYPTSLDDLVCRYTCVDSKKHVLLFEAYTELWAVVFMCIFKSFRDVLNRSPRRKRVLDTAILRDIQRSTEHSIIQHACFSCFQTAKIMYFYDITDLDDLNLRKRRAACNIFKQTSAVYSYYILKCALIMNLDSVMRLCEKHHAPITLWQFSMPLECFLIILRKSLQENGFVSTQAYFSRYIRKRSKSSRKKADCDPILTTMRLTLFP